MKRLTLVKGLLFWACLLSAESRDKWFFPCDLRVNALSNPQAVRPEDLRLSWCMEARGRSRRQTAYQIAAASSRESLLSGDFDLWDTGKVNSGCQRDIPYGGDLPPCDECVWWQVRLWDEVGRVSPWSAPAFFRIGPASEEQWQAYWIGAPGPSDPAIRDHNGYHSALVDTEAATAWVVVDLAEPTRINGVRLFPARPFDWSGDTPGFLFPKRFRVDVSDEKTFSRFTTVVDCTEADVPPPGTKPLTFRFPAQTARYVRLVVTRLGRRKDGRYAFALAELEVLSGNVNVALGGAVTASDSIEAGAWAKKYLTDGIRVSRRAALKTPLPCPLLRRSFTVEKPVREAILYATSLGLYEARLNGRRVGDHMLAPEMTDYHRRVQYQAYPVTDLLRKGENALGVILGDGWYAGRVGLSQVFYQGPLRGIYGIKPRFRCRLVIFYKDGTKEVIKSDPSWRGFIDGPIRKACILDGEVYDARKEIPGWDLPGFDDSAWKPVEAVPRIATRLVPQPNQPIRIVRRLVPRSIRRIAENTYIVDVGQNLAGWMRLELNQPRGTRIRLRHGEVLTPDGKLYRDNLRIKGPFGARQEDVYICKGSGNEIFEPHFTYHGFRYVEISGLKNPPPLLSMRACAVSSDAPLAGSFISSSTLLNRLMKAVLWTQRSNLHGMPTDCPQRDERLGWMGDAQVFCQTACFFMDMQAFLRKWITDMEDDQAPDGRFPDFAPHPYDSATRFSGAPCWADAGVFVPWRVYVNYSDTALVKRHFESARRWIEYVRIQSPGLVWTGNRGNNYGDWLNGDRIRAPGWRSSGCSLPTDELASAFFAKGVELLARMAKAAGKKKLSDLYMRLARETARAFWEWYGSPTGLIKGDTQAGYGLALAFGLVPEKLRSAVLKRLVSAIRERDWHLTTGIQTTVRTLEALSRCGRSDIAYRLVLDRRFPSWGYMLDHGATTIWERWDGYLEGRGFQNPGMNSFNHYAFGSVAEWVWRHAAGLNPDPSQPGWKRFTVRPEPGGGLTWVNAAYKSARGEIRVAWRLENDRFLLALRVPANCTAAVYVPKRGEGPVTEGTVELKTAEGAPRPPGVLSVRTAGRNVLCCTVGSGDYLFAAPWVEELQKE